MRLGALLRGTVNAMWWRVTYQDNVWLVLVVAGRVATFLMPTSLAVGDPWPETRRTLEASGFTCTMETL